MLRYVRGGSGSGGGPVPPQTDLPPMGQSDRAIFLTVQDQAIHSLSGRFGYSEPGYDLDICLGQSNEVGFAGAAAVDPLIDWLPERARCLSPDGAGNPAHALRLLKPILPLPWPDGGFDPSEYGPPPVASYLRHLEPYTPSSRIPVALVAAVGGVGLVNSGWQHPDGALYRQAFGAASHFLSLAPHNRLRSIRVSLGENDAQGVGGSTPALFRSALDAMLINLRADLDPQEEAFIVVNGMVPEWIDADPGTEYRAAVEAVLADTPRRIARCLYIPGLRGNHVGIHYDGPGSRTMGDQGARKLVQLSRVLTGKALMDPGRMPDAFGPAFLFDAGFADAPMFRLRHRPAGSGGAYSYLDHTPRRYWEAGDSLSHIFTDLPGDSEVSVAGVAHTTVGAYGAAVVVPWRPAPQALTRPDLGGVTATGNLIGSVPSLGANPAAWVSAPGKEPILTRWRGVPVVQTEVANSLLSCAASIPDGPYTKMVVVHHRSFDGVGTYMTASENWTDHLMRRTGAGLAVPQVVFRGGLSSVVASEDLDAAEWYAIFEEYDPSRPSAQLKLHVLKRHEAFASYVLVTASANAGARSPKAGLLLNAENPTGLNGNQALYADWAVWDSAIGEACIKHEGLLAFARLKI